jgi:hypothetical protein
MKQIFMYSPVSDMLKREIAQKTIDSERKIKETK